MSTVKSEGRRLKLLDYLLTEGSVSSYLKHYVTLDVKYLSENIYKEHNDNIKQKIRDNAVKNKYNLKSRSHHITVSEESRSCV